MHYSLHKNIFTFETRTTHYGEKQFTFEACTTHYSPGIKSANDQSIYMYIYVIFH